jgi:hypothetical protein
MSIFKELLGTDNKKEQEERIKDLLQIEATPEITLHIRYDGINDQVVLNLSGGDVSFDAVHRALELASKAIRMEEVNIAMQQQMQQGEDKDPESE